MKIALITFPTPTKDNFRAASALSYHLMKFKSEEIEIRAYSFNCNAVGIDQIKIVEKELNITIKIIPLPHWYVWMLNYHLTFLKFFLLYPLTYYMHLSSDIVREINQYKPDAIWINGDTLSRIVRLFPDKKRIMTLPDCVPLYYYRLFADKSLFSNVFRLIGNCILYRQNVRMVKEYPIDPSIHYHVVGQADKDFFEKINPKAQVSFIRHPHYDTSDEKRIAFHSPKIKMLIAGKYNIYMWTAFDELLDMLLSHPDLSKYYELTFLGSGWEFAVTKLNAQDYAVNQLGFVENYLNEIIKYDIQLVPISLGTGTKGKVLDALANGLLVIGTPYAMENIVVENEKSCIEYRNISELKNVLFDIPISRRKYEAIAENGIVQVRTFHRRSIVSNLFFTLIK